MVSTRLEVNLIRLLIQCELKVKENKHGDWRLEKYIRALMEMFEELKKSPCCPSQEELNNYVKKIEFLKGLIEAERMPSAAEKMLAAEKLSPANTSADPDPVSGKKLCHLTKGRYEKEMREDLFGIDHSNDNKMNNSDLRHRKSSRDQTDINAILQHHNEMQEKLAEEMLMLTRNLKNNVSAAKNIVGDDLRTLSDSSQLAGANMDKLKVETERLETYTNSCSWWVWLMIAAVTCTFLWMIIFIRIFHK